MNKLGFILSNYKAKLQVEIKSLQKKLNSVNNNLISKIRNIFLIIKLNKELKEKKEILIFLDNYINNLKNTNYNLLEKIVTKEAILKIKSSNLTDLKTILNSILK